MVFADLSLLCQCFSPQGPTCLRECLACNLIGKSHVDSHMSFVLSHELIALQVNIQDGGGGVLIHSWLVSWARFSSRTFEYGSLCSVPDVTSLTGRCYNPGQLCSVPATMSLTRRCYNSGLCFTSTIVVPENAGRRASKPPFPR